MSQDTDKKQIEVNTLPIDTTFEEAVQLIRLAIDEDIKMLQWVVSSPDANLALDSYHRYCKVPTAKLVFSLESKIRTYSELLNEVRHQISSIKYSPNLDTVDMGELLKQFKIKDTVHKKGSK